MRRHILRSRRLAIRARGFTLVELAIVVAIVGVLAVIAVVGYRKIMLSSKMTEATNMVSAIRIAQEDYKVERGTYANIGTTTWCPTDGSTLVKTGWDTNCSGGTLTWAALPVHIDGAVQFGYKTVATGATLPTFTWIDMTAAIAAAPNRPWFVITAQADLDLNTAAKTEVVGMSFQSTIFTRNEGE